MNFQKAKKMIFPVILVYLEGAGTINPTQATSGSPPILGLIPNITLCVVSLAVFQRLYGFSLFKKRVSSNHKSNTGHKLERFFI